MGSGYLPLHSKRNKYIDEVGVAKAEKGHSTTH